MVLHGYFEAFAGVMMVRVIEALGVQEQGQAVGLAHFGAGLNLSGERRLACLRPEHLRAEGVFGQALVEAQLRLDEGAKADVRAEEGQKRGRVRLHLELAETRVEHRRDARVVHGHVPDEVQRQDEAGVVGQELGPVVAEAGLFVFGGSGVCHREETPMSHKSAYHELKINQIKVLSPGKRIKLLLRQIASSYTHTYIG